MHLGEDTLPLVGPEEEILVQEGGCTLERTLYLWWDLMRRSWYRREGAPWRGHSTFGGP